MSDDPKNHQEKGLPPWKVVVDKMEEAERILPAWFVGRMMGDVWHFGLLLSTGAVLFVECINRVWQAANGDVWIDVRLAEGDAPSKFCGVAPSGSPTIRAECSVNARHIVAAVELAGR